MVGTTTLARLDAALIGLRRIWSSPTSRPVDEGSWPGIELSTVLVGDAVHRLTVDAAEAEGSKDPATVTAVAALLGVAHSTASRLVDRAVQVGVVQRKPSVADARRTVLTLTERGEDLVAAAEVHRHAVLEGLLSAWPAREVDALAELLARFAAEVQAHEHSHVGAGRQTPARLHREGDRP